MAKRRGGPAGGGMGGLVRHAQKMQQKMAKIQDELKTKTVDGTAGGGMVRITMNGQQEMVAIKIDREVVDPDDVMMLEDLIKAAFSDAMSKASALAEDDMSEVTGGLNIPGLM